jgi:uncharacterized protein (DUF362 family)
MNLGAALADDDVTANDVLAAKLLHPQATTSRIPAVAR